MAYLGPSLRRKKLYERPAARAAAAVIASLAVNALLLWALASAGAFQLPGKDSARTALAPVSAGEWAKNRAVVGAPPAPPPAAVPTPKPEDEPKVQGQVVDVAPSDDARKPKDSRFLSDHDSTVERETRSRFAGTQKYKNTLPAPSDGPDQKASARGGPAPLGKEGAKGAGANAGAAAERRKPQEDKLALVRPEPRKPGELPAEPKGRERVPPPGAPGNDGAGPSPAPGDPGGHRSGQLDSKLLPDAASLARIAGGPSPDRLDGIDESERTALNTQSFKYATFINRVGEAVYREWDPNRAYSARDPDATVYPHRDRTTGVDLVMDPSGALEMVKVLEKSGLDFLDFELVRAARAAAPFPNPPAAMIAGDAKIHVLMRFTLLAARQVRFQVVVPASPSQRPYPEP